MQALVAILQALTATLVVVGVCGFCFDVWRWHLRPHFSRARIAAKREFW